MATSRRNFLRISEHLVSLLGSCCPVQELSSNGIFYHVGGEWEIRKESSVFASDQICAELSADPAFFCDTNKHIYKNLE